jgi:hypothetical protein
METSAMSNEAPLYNFLVEPIAPLLTTDPDASARQPVN